MQIATSRFTSVRSTVPRSWCSTWAELVAELFDHRGSSEKAGRALWSPNLYTAESRRSNAAVELVTCAVVDVDDGTPIEMLEPALHGIEWVAYTTWAHTETQPRYHLVMPLEVPVIGAEWPAVSAALRGWLGCGDALGDPARMYFLPQHQRGRGDWWVMRGFGAALRVTPPGRR